MDHFKPLFGSGTCDPTKILPLKDWDLFPDFLSALGFRLIMEFSSTPDQRQKAKIRIDHDWQLTPAGANARGHPAGVTMTQTAGLNPPFISAARHSEQSQVPSLLTRTTISEFY